MKFTNKLFRDKSGATAIEYGLLAALIGIAAIMAMNAVSQANNVAVNDTTEVSAGD